MRALGRGMIVGGLVVGALWLLFACFVDGRRYISSTEPDYALLCGDSAVTTSTYVCEDTVTVEITIQNPNRGP